MNMRSSKYFFKIKEQLHSRLKPCAIHERTSETAEDHAGKVLMLQKQQTTRVHRALEPNASFENKHELHKGNTKKLEIH